MQPAWRLAEESGLLFQKHIDAVEEHGSPDAIVGLVQVQWEIEWHHQSGMPQFAQGADKGVVPETVSTIHAARAGSDLDNIHVLMGRTDALAPVASFLTGKLNAS